MKKKYTYKYHTLRFNVILLLAGSFGFATLQAQQEEEKEEEIVVLSPFEVFAEEDRGYGVTHSLGGTRISIPMDETALSIITANQEIIQDTQAHRFQEAVRYISGVAITSSPAFGRITIRGWDVGGVNVRDGLRSGGLGNGGVGMIDFAMFDRAEIIKGPAGVLYGRHNLGGLANLVSKRPLKERKTELTFTGFSGKAAAEHGVRVTFDATGPIGNDKKLRYRMIGTFQEADHRSGQPIPQFNFNPQFEYHVNADTKLRVWANYTDRKFQDVELNFIDSDAKLHTFFKANDRAVQLGGEFNDQYLLEVETSFITKFSMFGIDWSINLTGRYHNSRQDRNFSGYPQRDLYDSAGNYLGRHQDVSRDHPDIATMRVPRWLYLRFNTSSEGGLVNFDLTSQFDTGPVNHRLFTLVQFNHSRSRSHNPIKFVVSDPSDPRWANGVADGSHVPVPGRSTTPDFELWPNFEVIPNFLELVDRQNPTGFFQNAAGESDAFHWAMQDNLSFFDGRLIGVVGIRYDWSSSKNVNFRANPDGRLTKSPGSNWGNKYGVIVKPIEGVSIFYNYSETFAIVNTTDVRLGPTFGEKYPNRVGENNEFGVKFNLLENRLIATASYFDINDTNVLVRTIDFLGTVTGFPSTSYFELGGEGFRSEGVEFDVALQPTDNLSLTFSVSDLKAVLPREGGSDRRRRNVPQNTWAVFGKYQFLEGPLNGFSFGFGAEHTADRSGDGGDSFSLPDYTIFDAFVGYQREKWGIQVNIFNLTDELWIPGSTAGNSMMIGDPFNFKIRLRYSF